MNIVVIFQSLPSFGSRYYALSFNLVSKQSLILVRVDDELAKRSVLQVREAMTGIMEITKAGCISEADAFTCFYTT